MSGRLAIDGGSPVRERPLPSPLRGAAALSAEEQRAVMDVIARRSPFRYYGPDLGHYVRGFETALAAKLGVRHTLGVTSGTSALIVALRALGVGPGDEVIVPAATFVASALAVVACNAVPVFADVDASLGLDAKDAETRISTRTKAIMPV
ncbi:MAG TPA: aminotransferase class I/II-fold pyridoxal phosphate-dependent enzyme, partial [Limnochordia bacterium]|nr:aminotransferase class I/II-fold pyridoxal phosphate-dependent enzyme [Limnochordia bacterium]